MLLLALASKQLHDVQLKESCNAQHLCHGLMEQVVSPREAGKSPIKERPFYMSWRSFEQMPYDQLRRLETPCKIRMLHHTHGSILYPANPTPGNLGWIILTSPCNFDWIFGEAASLASDTWSLFIVRIFTYKAPVLVVICSHWFSFALRASIPPALLPSPP